MSGREKGPGEKWTIIFSIQCVCPSHASKAAQALTSPFLCLHHLLPVVGLLAALTRPEPAGTSLVDDLSQLSSSFPTFLSPSPSFLGSVLWSVPSWTLNLADQPAHRALARMIVLHLFFFFLLWVLGSVLQLGLAVLLWPS